MATYFRCVLMLPIVVGLLAPIIPGLMNLTLVKFTSVGLLLFGIPYLIFLLSALFWSYRRTGDEYSIAMFIAPFVFGIAIFIFSAIFFKIGNAFGASYFATIVSAVYAWPALLIWHFVRFIRRTPSD